MTTENSSAQLSPRAARYRWVVIVLLILNSVINSLDRHSLAIANPLIAQELGLSPSEMGFLLSAFLWAYAFAQLPSGYLIDRFGPRKMIRCSIVLWSLSQMAGGISRSLGQFFAARLALGLFEAPNAPSAAAVLAKWFPRDKRGLPISLVFSGGQLGALLGPPLLTVLMLTFGWRSMFLICGVTGLVIVANFAWMYRDPQQFGLSREEFAAIGDGNPEGADNRRFSFADWKGMFRHRTMWGLVLGFAGQNYVQWLFLTWLPGYLQKAHHVSIAHTGVLASIPTLFGYLGALAAGTASDRLIGSGMPVLSARRLVPVCGMIGVTVCAGGLAMGPGLAVSLALVSGTLFFSNLAGTGCWALVTAIAPQRAIGTVGSVMNFGGFTGAALAPIVTGILVERTGSFVLSLAIGGVMAALAGVFYAGLIRKPLPADD
ncbi:MAG: MFS transporter [Sphingomonadales bacterium]|nr:MFS transporter [Sphingomonadales bacterium]